MLVAMNGVWGIGSLAVAYGGALSVAPFFVVQIFWLPVSGGKKHRLPTPCVT
jgi:hypothetical protein